MNAWILSKDIEHHKLVYDLILYFNYCLFLLDTSQTVRMWCCVCIISTTYVTKWSLDTTEDCHKAERGRRLGR